jgi:hypothetical protein
MTRGLETASTRIEGRPTGPLVADRGANLLLPLPSWSFPPHLKEGRYGGKEYC